MRGRGHEQQKGFHGCIIRRTGFSPRLSPVSTVNIFVARASLSCGACFIRGRLSSLCVASFRTFLWRWLTQYCPGQPLTMLAQVASTYTCLDRACHFPSFIDVASASDVTLLSWHVGDIRIGKTCFYGALALYLAA